MRRRRYAIRLSPCARAEACFSRACGCGPERHRSTRPVLARQAPPWPTGRRGAPVVVHDLLAQIAAGFHQLPDRHLPLVCAQRGIRFPPQAAIHDQVAVVGRGVGMSGHVVRCESLSWQRSDPWQSTVRGCPACCTGSTRRRSCRPGRKEVMLGGSAGLRQKLPFSGGTELESREQIPIPMTRRVQSTRWMETAVAAHRTGQAQRFRQG
jgi:hypothetical protein